MSTNLETPMPGTSGVKTVADVQAETVEGDEDGEAGEETETVAGPRAGGDADNVRELQDTPKPKAKCSGKKTSQKLEVQHRNLEKSLPEEEAFTLLHKLQCLVNDHITSYKHSQVVTKANFMPDVTNEVLQVEQPTVVRQQPPPPLMMI